MFALFGLNKTTAIIIGVLILLLGVSGVGSYYWIRHLNTNIDNLNKAAVVAELTISGLNKQIQTDKEDAAKKDQAIAVVQQKNSILNKNFDKLMDKLNKEELKKTAVSNPSAAETMVNQDLYDFNRCAGLLECPPENKAQ